MGRESIVLPGTSARPLHHQYEARLSTFADENGFSYGKALPHRTAKRYAKLVRSKHIYSDRFIPSRLATKLDAGFGLTSDPPSHYSNQQLDSSNATGSSATSSLQSGLGTSTAPGSSSSASDSNPKHHGQHTGGSSPYSMLLKSELLGIHSSPRANYSSDYHSLAGHGHSSSGSLASSYSTGRGSGGIYGPPSDGGGFSSCVRGYNGSTACIRPSSGASSNILRFKAPRQSLYGSVKTTTPLMGLTSSSQRLFGSGLHDGDDTRRRISRLPFKVLDAPALQDDFYLNLVDWSATNVVAVGLGACIYLWSACTSKVTKLCDLGAGDSVTSVCWSQRGTHLSVGTNSGDVQIWDVSAGKKIRTMPYVIERRFTLPSLWNLKLTVLLCCVASICCLFSGHMARIGTLAWSGQTLASGSRDRTILLRDLRASTPYQTKLAGHKQEVCGLKWSFDDRQLASGGNDNKLLVWSVRSASSSLRGDVTTPLARFNDHSAAVKAIAWSPHQHGLLASGGGTADRCIRFWNTQSLTALPFVDTGSQVCNLMWAKNANEVVSTHGYSLNQIIVWKYPTMTKLATLTGHTFRVLYLAMSPDGQTIVTGAGDETLRFWNAFPSSKTQRGSRLGTDLLLPLGRGSEIR
ncbi:hypothetical protein BBJ28_00013052 [Nothophytophthora sp. Chile5]|nr:hypothetical protein BBJ28_00013052 [Nothophytophthora sp. Chile5]